MTMYQRVYAKLLELHSNLPLFSNSGEKVLKSRKTCERFGTDFQDLLPAIGKQ
jgi:hypothetical protein